MNLFLRSDLQMRKLRFKQSKVAQLWSPTSRGHAIGHQAPLSWRLSLSFEREENISPYQCQCLTSQIHSGEDGPWQQAVCRLCVLSRVCSDPIGHTIYLLVSPKGIFGFGATPLGIPSAGLTKRHLWLWREAAGCCCASQWEG